MIPLQLTLKNFLSYREATLDFRGLHTACICGANGAGKSSLLEAITWTIWGQSRAASEDDLIHGKEKNVRVDFQFINNEQTYRIIRSRTRGRSSSLEFQVQNGNKFRSLSGKGLRTTQQKVITNLKLDYDTFINSAYLRQGRADEFMLRRPSERKQILADLLKLDRYEELANQAKDLSKQYKGQVEQLEISLEPLQQQLAQREEIVQQQENLAKELEALQQVQERDRAQLNSLQGSEHQRQTWQQQLTWQQRQYQKLSQDCDRLEQERATVQGQLRQLQKLLAQEEEITTGYQRLWQLQQEEEILSAKFPAYQDAQQHKQQLEQQLLQRGNELKLQLRTQQSRLEAIEQQEKEIEQVLSHRAEVQAGLEKLRHHRQRLSELDRLQNQVSPLLQNRHNLQREIERVEARLAARLEQLKTMARQLSWQMDQVPEMRRNALAVYGQISELDKKRIYQQRLEEKGSQRKELQHRLEEQQRLCEGQLAELQQKLDLLQTPEATCPLCEQELDEQHRHRVIHKTQAQQQGIQEQFWTLREQMAVCERELKGLRTEYAQLTQELAAYDDLQLQLGQLEAQLEATEDIYTQLQQIKGEMEELERSLAMGNYADALQSELRQLNQELQRLNYDEQTHALVRGEVERLRWAEIKQAKIEDGNRRLGKLKEQKPQIIERIANLQAEIAQLRQNSDLQQQIERVERQIQELGYERSHHNQLLISLRQAQPWQLRYQQLQQAQQQYPQLQEKLQELEQLLKVRLEDQTNLKRELANLTQQMAQITDSRAEIQSLEQQIQQRRRKLDELLAQQGRLQQSLAQLDKLKVLSEETRQQIQEVRQQSRIYQELALAFGKNGIQSLMIENILPQLEAETNQILARLTENQFHVQFVTQRASRSSTFKKKSAKLIDTLDILIADTGGTRPYETYSGGEAFRINFSIRLALAQLLAQRAGTALQLLIIDEGFGTQDAEGCERLVAAINAIAPDFACILTVTHMPQFKEAFQHRIEVRKTESGSQLILLT